MRKGRGRPLLETDLSETKGLDEGAHGPLRVRLGGVEDAVLAGGGLDLLLGRGAGHFDEVVVGAQVKGGVVAVVDPGLVLVKARGEYLGLGQPDGDGVVPDLHVVLAEVAEVNPGLDVPGRHEEHLLAGEQAVQRVVAGALARHDYRLGNAHGGKLVEPPHALDDDGRRRSPRRPLLQERPDQGHPLCEVEAADPDADGGAQGDAQHHYDERQHKRRRETPALLAQNRPPRESKKNARGLYPGAGGRLGGSVPSGTRAVSPYRRSRRTPSGSALSAERRPRRSRPRRTGGASHGTSRGRGRRGRPRPSSPPSRGCSPARSGAASAGSGPAPLAGPRWTRCGGPSSRTPPRPPRSRP